MGGTQPERKVGKQGEKRTREVEEKGGGRQRSSPNRALVFVVFNGEEEAEARTQSRRPETQSRPRFVVACFRVPPLPPSRPRLNRAVRPRCRVVACARATTHGRTTAGQRAASSNQNTELQDKVLRLEATVNELQSGKVRPFRAGGEARAARCGRRTTVYTSRIVLWN